MNQAAEAHKEHTTNLHKLFDSNAQIKFIWLNKLQHQQNFIICLV